MKAPMITRPHGSSPFMIPSMIRAISRAFGALNFSTFVPSSAVVTRPLIPGSTSQATR